MEITVGRPIVDPRTQQLKGTMMKINSSKGKIVSIEAGLARYVVMVEHEGDDCEPVR